MRRLYFTDSIIFWAIAGYTADSQTVYEVPILIKGRFDGQSLERQEADKVESHVYSVTVFPDRVLSVNSVLLLGNEETLASLSPVELKNPLLIYGAVTIKSQSVVSEFGYPQKSNWPVGMKNKRLTISCTCS
jgi:hypothetical protein